MPNPLPDDLSVRAATGDDVPALHAFFAACDAAEYSEAFYTSLDDVREWVNKAAQTWLISTPTGAIAGYGSLNNQEPARLHADVYTHPQQTGRGIATWLLYAIEERARELMQQAPEGARVELFNGTNAKNGAAREINERAGFHIERYFWRMRIDMTAPPPAPVWPEGITVRAFVLGQDDHAVYDAVEEAFEDHWGWSRTPYEDFAQRFAKAEFDPNLWFLALAGDTIAGVTLGTPEGANGWISKVAVRRPWRKRGLAMALLRHTFGAFYQQGRMRVELGVDAASLTGAQRLYEQAGMRVAAEFAVFAKELRAGPTPSADGEGL